MSRTVAGMPLMLTAYNVRNNIQKNCYDSYTSSRFDT
jgi:hypothetical protein